MSLSTFILLVFVVYLLHVLLRRTKRRLRVAKLINELPGPPVMPLVGNAVEINVEHDDLFTRLTCTSSIWGGDLGMNRAWLGDQPYVFLFKAQTVEPLLSSNKAIEKSRDYRYLRPWLGTGLLTSTGHKWHFRRKILTPTFHFRILEDFIDVFREQSQILVDHLAREVDNTGFNLFPYITLCTLDVICETAMGRQVNAQGNSHSEYVKAIYEIGDIIQNRQAKIWLQPSWLFWLSKLYAAHEKCIRILHGFSYKVIRERREELTKQKAGLVTDDGVDDIIGKKKRLAFLDLLIEASENGSVLSDDDIREEVDTFMFEDKVYAEVESILSEQPISIKSLHEMRYLECCIKEALRLYPSVPMYGRHLHQDLTIGSYTIPAGTTAIVNAYVLHRDPEVYRLPDVFDPDRFLSENTVGRHPYAYVPFSAGPRNCIDKLFFGCGTFIGQKFAMLEEKVVVASVIRNFQVTAVDRREDITLLSELILRPKSGLTVRITRRK